MLPPDHRSRREIAGRAAAPLSGAGQAARLEVSEPGFNRL